MKKLTTLLLTITALLAFTACGDFISTKDNHETTDSHDVTTTTTNNGAETNTTERGTTVDSSNTLEVPTFTGNSQGKLVVQCEDDIVYYIMAYDSLNPDTKPSVTVDSGDLTVDEVLIHEGEVFYTSGHVERTDAVTITGHVFSGGVTLSTTWGETCE
jgi:uncharacterized membrane protein